MLLLKQNFKNIFKSLWNNLSVNKSSAALESQLNYSNSSIPFKQVWEVLSNTLYLTLKLNPRITISSKFSKHFPLWSYSGQTICWRRCKRIRGLPQNWSCRTRTVLVKHVICVQENLCSNKVDVEAPEEEEEEVVPLLLEGARNTPSSAREGGPPPP